MHPLSLPHAEARRVFATGAPVYVSVNPVEYHGPHLSLRNDALVSHGLIRALHQRLARRREGWPMLIAEDLEVGVEPVPGPGSRPVSMTVVRDLVLRTCRSLAEMGARHIVLMTFHGSPLHAAALHDAARTLSDEGVRTVAPLNQALHYLGTADPNDFAAAFEGIADPAERAQVMRDLPYDFHAGFMETSVSLCMAPSGVAGSYTTLPPCPPITPQPLVTTVAAMLRRLRTPVVASELDAMAQYMGWLALKPFPGYTSRPHLASAAAGEVFVDFLLDLWEPLALDVFDGRAESPAPPMTWASALSLEGRLLPHGDVDVA